MLIRARQAALAPQILHRPPPTPLPAAVRAPALGTAVLSTVAGTASAPPMSAAPASLPAAPPTAAPAHVQHPPTSSLHIAAALAGQSSNPMLAVASGSAAIQPVVSAPQPPAATAPALATAGATLAPAAPPLPNAPANAQTPRLQSSQSASAEPSVGAPSSGQTLSQSAGAAYVPSSVLSSAAAAASTAPSAQHMGPLASLLPGQLSAATAVATDTTAVPGRGRGAQMVHKASLDVLRLKLRLIDLVQGCAALQPKVGCTCLCCMCQGLPLHACVRAFPCTQGRVCH